MISAVLDDVYDRWNLEPCLLAAWFDESSRAGPDGMTDAVRQAARHSRRSTRYAQKQIERFRYGLVKRLADLADTDLDKITTSLLRDSSCDHRQRLELSLAAATVWAWRYGFIVVEDSRHTRWKPSRTNSHECLRAISNDERLIGVHNCGRALLAAGHAVMTGWLSINRRQKRTIEAIAPWVGKRLRYWDAPTTWPSMVGAELLQWLPNADSLVMSRPAVTATRDPVDTVAELQAFGNMTIAHGAKQRATTRRHRRDRERYIRQAERFAKRASSAVPYSNEADQFLANLALASNPQQSADRNQDSPIDQIATNDVLVRRALNDAETAILLSDFHLALDLLGAVDSRIRPGFWPAQARAARMTATAHLGLGKYPPDVEEKARHFCGRFPYDKYLLGMAEACHGAIRQLYQI